MKEYKVRKPSMWQRHIEIQKQDGMPVGELKWGSAFSSKASAVISGNVWSFSINSWYNKIIITDNSGMEIGMVKMSAWQDKTVLTYKGREYQMKRLNWSSSVYIWYSSMQQKLISVKMNIWSSKKIGSIRVYTQREDELNELLTVLGWYIYVIKTQQSSG